MCLDTAERRAWLGGQRKALMSILKAPPGRGLEECRPPRQAVHGGQLWRPSPGTHPPPPKPGGCCLGRKDRGFRPLGLPGGIPGPPPWVLLQLCHTLPGTKTGKKPWSRPGREHLISSEEGNRVPRPRWGSQLLAPIFSKGRSLQHAPGVPQRGGIKQFKPPPPGTGDRRVV